jgi:hypothetical protein
MLWARNCAAAVTTQFLRTDLDGACRRWLAGIPQLPLTGPRAALIIVPLVLAISVSVPLGCFFCCHFFG